ncbi:MAG: hypothetical protein LDLANPLL_00768 [Turneriella sp.]|nr:hypothetical protein [Turneriella sp.]
MKGWVYILRCADGSYYTGSTNNLELRLQQHKNGEGANYTKKRLPIELVYCEQHSRIDKAFYREKQIQGWSHKKKEALVTGQHANLPEFAIAYRDKETVTSRASVTEEKVPQDISVSAVTESISSASTTVASRASATGIVSLTEALTVASSASPSLVSRASTSGVIGDTLAVTEAQSSVTEALAVTEAQHSVAEALEATDKAGVV